MGDSKVSSWGNGQIVGIKVKGEGACHKPWRVPEVQRLASHLGVG